MADDYNLGACTTPWCTRKVSKASAYCCGGCTMAHETESDPDHSRGCNQRAAERGEWTVEQAEMKRRR